MHLYVFSAINSIDIGEPTPDQVDMLEYQDTVSIDYAGETTQGDTHQDKH
jgi:hypothetical protein